jgi:hypothetical protein
MTSAPLELPEDTPGVDGGNAFTVTPGLPFFVYDGGSSTGTSNPSLDGGSASSVPVLNLDEGC